MSAISGIATGAAELLERDGWAPSGEGGADIMSAIQSSIWAEGFDEEDDLYINVWTTIASHLSPEAAQSLMRTHRVLHNWEREPGRTQAEVVAMLREVAAKADA
jgi:hypothetical protein